MSTNELILAGVNVVAQIAIHELSKCLENRRKRKRSCWVRDWEPRATESGESNTLIRELQFDDEASFENNFRMNKDNFEHLLSLIECHIQRADTHMRNAIPARVKLQVTLSYLVSGDSLSSLQYAYRVPKTTISKFLSEVLDAVYVALEDYIKTPHTLSEWKEIRRGFATRCNFPGCIGAIGGKHVMLRCPLSTDSSFLNDNGDFSIILVALVDSNYCFTYVDVGAAGGESNASVFSRSQLKAGIERGTLNVPMNAVIVGDAEFPLKTYLMKPYSTSGVLTIGQKIFNDRLSRTHRISENAFEILASKFRIFEKPISLSVDKVDKVVLASCTLHNWLSKTSQTYCSSGLTDMKHLETGSTSQGLRHDVNGQGLFDVKTVGRKNHSKKAAEIRDKYCKYFLMSGSVS